MLILNRIHRIEIRIIRMFGIIMRIYRKNLK
jgi:hypothetical protein